MTLTASSLHDALRSEGLVPPEEDVHLLACSNRWRHALERIEHREIASAFEVIIEEMRGEVSLAESKQEQAEEDRDDADRALAKAEKRADAAEDARDNLRSILDKAKGDASEAEAERDRALERAVELEAELAKLKGTP